MELAWLEDFLALVELCSFSRAAERRNVTQPAFGRRIKALEHWAGATLFDRSSHRIVPTAAADALRPVAEEAVRQLQRGRDLARETGQASAATLIFASTHLLASTFFPRWLPLIEGDLGAEVSVQFVVDSMVACERLMRRGEANLLLCHHHASAPSELESHAFLRRTVGLDRMVAVSAPDPEGRPLHPVPTEGGGRIAFLAYRPESGLGRILERSGVLRDVQANLDSAFHAHAALTLAGMARAGRGLAWLPLSDVRRDLADGRLVKAAIGENLEVDIDICLIRSSARQSPAVEAFWALTRTEPPRGLGESRLVSRPA